MKYTRKTIECNTFYALGSNWYQSGHFNDKCPYVVPHVPGLRRPVGCVATAMAQIVNYWQYPSRLRFDAADWPDGDAYYSEGWPGIDIDDEAGAYGFPTFSELNSSLAVINYDGDNDEESYLCFAAGVKLRMSYGIFGSGAVTSAVDDVLEDHFSFGSAQSAYAHSGIWSQYRDHVIENVKDAWPVQLAIHESGESGGHSVVVDGYQDSGGFFHINLGWSGTSEDTWYDLPDIRSYDVIHTVVYDIAPYYAWHQVGADERNSFRSPYAAPIQAPERKWEVTVPGDLSSYRFDHLVVGAAGRIYGALGPDDLGQGYNPYVCVIHPHGYIEKRIQIPDSDYDINFLTQNYRGEVFFGTSEYLTKTSVFRIDPETEVVTRIFDHTSPDSGVFDQPIKVDHDDYLYFVIGARYVGNSARFYCMTRSGSVRWSHTFPLQMKFYTSMAAVDEARNQVYLNYYDSSAEKSYLVCLNRSYHNVEWTHEFPGTHSASAMAGPPAIGADGTIYVGSHTTLYGLSPEDGAQSWEQDFYPAYAYRTPAIGPDGTLYVNYGKMVGSTWHPGFVRAIDPSNGAIRWERELSPPLGESDHMGEEVYAARNGLVCVSYDREDVHRTAGLVDHGSWGEVVWDVGYGGIMGFGPSETVFLIPHEQDASIYALSVGDRGDPDGLAMDFTNNEPPVSPSGPVPADGATGQPTSVTLSWSCSDPEGHDLEYDVFVCALVEGQEAAFVPMATGISTNSHALSGLDAGIEHLWMVTATDGQAVSEGPTWGFATVPPLDSDDDGVPDGQDQCPGTQVGETVDAYGCSCSQLDDDGDGVDSCDDQCPDTPDGEIFDANGCSCSQLDNDGDGVNNCDDQCPDTPDDETVDANGCSCSQLDDDGDGVPNCIDNCLDVPNQGQADCDGDGIGDACDTDNCEEEDDDDQNDVVLIGADDVAGDGDTVDGGDGGDEGPDEPGGGDPSDDVQPVDPSASPEEATEDNSDPNGSGPPPPPGCCPTTGTLALTFTMLGLIRTRRRYRVSSRREVS